jgi:hypothetical protein
VRFIDWISAVPLDEPTSQVTLEYSTTGPEGPWTLIASALPNNGRYQWIVPQENSNDCYIQYSVTAGNIAQSGITPAAFTITDGTIGVSEAKQEKFDLTVCPNPASSQLAVRSSQSAVSGRRLSVRILVTDLSGRELMYFGEVSSFPYIINISDLQPGLFVIKMTMTDGISSSVKFLKVPE